ncbi:putative 8-amino-7-oxononanoate synthase [Leptospira inadai serovar Lyme str. 10]|uniref:8-amino-7-oxononanoate synthase n=2 Tax=Leptospira inadai serovar Lyme TaxID=293084 RepID=V6HBL3_9LEPT|nr:8-amino-7-oxononanoate synthase [Leptospira inadai]EQA37066.1 putative 8-amino-7-oxononanoate synthase [Leptospira inadai serovar Lyme str. 10]PNV76603.1 8-amino-7-oxononanoate synthase [Leptospira inadai serovar Lyme]
MRELRTFSVPFYGELPAFFSRLESTNRIRSLDPPIGIDLCSNDYLGLSQHPEIIESLKEGIDLFGAGSTASRLVRGHRDVFSRLEDDFSSWVDSEASLFFANGYAANLGTLSCVCDPSYVVFADRKNHASLMDGIRLSGAKKVYYRHLDLNHLEQLLRKHSSSKHKIIVTETVFSMDGDVAQIRDLLELKDRYGALLYLDEAHAIGLFGPKGAGFANSQLSSSELEGIDFRMATLGKALGLEGAMVSCTAEVRKFLLHSARTFVFSTGSLPAIAHAGRTAVRLAKSMDAERKRVEEFSLHLRKGIEAKGYSFGRSSSQIVPILLENEKEALELATLFEAAGFQAKAIRPPTVDISRIRVSINAKLHKEDLILFLSILRER